MPYGGETVLDLRIKLLDKQIKEEILNFDGMSPEDKCILLEEYSEKYREISTYINARREV